METTILMFGAHFMISSYEFLVVLWIYFFHYKIIVLTTEFCDIQFQFIRIFFNATASNIQLSTEARIMKIEIDVQFPVLKLIKKVM